MGVGADPPVYRDAPAQPLCLGTVAELAFDFVAEIDRMQDDNERYRSAVAELKRIVEALEGTA